MQSTHRANWIQPCHARTIFITTWGATPAKPMWARPAREIRQCEETCTETTGRRAIQSIPAHRQCETTDYLAAASPCKADDNMMESSPDTRVHNCGPMATETNGNGKAGREFHTPEKEAGRHAATRSLLASQARKEGTVQHNVYSTAIKHNTCAGRPHPIVADVVSYAATSPRKLSHYPEPNECTGRQRIHKAWLACKAAMRGHGWW